MTTKRLSVLARKTISLSTVHWSESFDVRNRSSWPRPNELVAAFRSLMTKPMSENQWICVFGACQRLSAGLAVAFVVTVRGRVGWRRGDRGRAGDGRGNRHGLRGGARRRHLRGGQLRPQGPHFRLELIEPEDERLDRGGAGTRVAGERRSARRLRPCRRGCAPQRQAEAGREPAATGGPGSGSRTAQGSGMGVRTGLASGPGARSFPQSTATTRSVTRCAGPVTARNRVRSSTVAGASSPQRTVARSRQRLAARMLAHETAAQVARSSSSRASASRSPRWSRTSTSRAAA